MTDFSDFKAQVAEWANRSDWSDVLVTSFIRMAEEKLNAELRVDRMITFAMNTITCRCATLPDNWLESDFVSIANANGPNGWLPIRYKSRDEFFNLTDKLSAYFYTIEGRVLTVGGTPDATEGVPVKISYYGEVPTFADDVPSWVYTKYPALYLDAALYHTALHAVGEEASAANFKQLAEEKITKLNNAHLMSKSSGSRITRTRVRSFG